MWIWNEFGLLLLIQIGFNNWEGEKERIQGAGSVEWFNNKINKGPRARTSEPTNDRYRKVYLRWVGYKGCGALSSSSSSILKCNTAQHTAQCSLPVQLLMQLLLNDVEELFFLLLLLLLRPASPCRVCYNSFCVSFQEGKEGRRNGAMRAEIATSCYSSLGLSNSNTHSYTKYINSFASGAIFPPPFEHLKVKLLCASPHCFCAPIQNVIITL